MHVMFNSWRFIMKKRVKKKKHKKIFKDALRLNKKIKIVILGEGISKGNIN